MMHREKIEQLAARMPLAKGYHFELLTRAEIGPLVDFIETWFPDIKVGGASCYLRARFYTEKVFLEDTPERDVFVVLLKRGDELAGMFSCERDLDTRSLYAAPRGSSTATSRRQSGPGCDDVHRGDWPANGHGFHPRHGDLEGAIRTEGIRARGLAVDGDHPWI